MVSCMRKPLSIGGALLLSACNLAPAYRQPISHVSDVFPDTPPSTSSHGASAADLGWRDFFGDEQLKGLIAASLANNRNLAQSVARIEQARAQFRIQQAQRLPAVDGNANYTKTHQPLGATGFGDLAGGGALPTSINFQNYAVNVAVSSFELDFWGRVRNLSAAAKADFLSSVEAARAFRLSLISDVAASYYALRSAKERIALAERTLAARLQGEKIARERLEAGVTSTVDYDQTVLLVTQARADLAELLRSEAQTRNQLTVLIGGPSPLLDNLPDGRPLADAGQFDRIEAGLPSDLLRNRPDIRQAEYDLRAADANIGAARAAFFPAISLTGNFGFVAPALRNLFDGSSKTWSYGPAISLPLFDWGRRKADLNLSKARRDELVAAYQLAVQEGFREVADALVARQRYKEQIEALTRTVETQQRLSRTARRRYDQGLSIYLEVLDAERSLFAAQQQLIDLRSTALQNGVSLYVALGGGTKTASGDTALSGLPTPVADPGTPQLSR